MSTLVIKSWAVSATPIDTKNNYVRIVGRQGGFISWFLSLIRIDPVTTILVGAERLEFSSASLAGTAYRMIPLQSIASTYYGYHKPWTSAAAIMLMFLLLAPGVAELAKMDDHASAAAFLMTVFVGVVLGLLYYILNRTLTLGFVEVSGVASGIQFKRSVIENIDVNDVQARQVCLIVQDLIEARQRAVGSSASRQAG